MADFLEVTVLLDRELSLSTSVSVPRGSTVAAVKAELCNSDPTGQTRPADVALADGATGHLLRDGELLTEELAPRLELRPGGSDDAEGAGALAGSEPVVETGAQPVAEATAEPAEVPSTAALAEQPAESTTTVVAALAEVADSVAPAPKPRTSAPELGAILARVAEALAQESDSNAANAVFGRIGGALKFKSLQPQLLLARGLLFWRWARLERAVQDVTDARRRGAAGADLALLALQICLQRWPEVKEALQELLQHGQVAESSDVEGRYEVVHEFVTLRNEASTKGRIVGTVKKGAHILGMPWDVGGEPWIKLVPQTLPAPAPGAAAKEVLPTDAVFALTDASSLPKLNLGVLLRRCGGALDLTALAGQVEHWLSQAEKFQLIFFPQAAAMEEGAEELWPGVRREADLQVPGPGGALLGLRLMLQTGSDGRPATDRPLVLVFHGEDENVSHWAELKNFGPLQEARASGLIADYRAYGFSTGTPSVAWLCADADCICDALPQAFRERGLPWPWPGRLAVLGCQLGSRVACYLAATRSQLFEGGVILDSAWCGSRAPGAAPPPDGKRHTALASMGCNAVGGNRFGTAEMGIALAELGRSTGALLARAGFASAAHLGYIMDNEDLIRGFSGRLLILHGGEDHQIPPEHAQRLCDAAEAATRKLVIARGKMQDSLRSSREYAEALKKFLAGA